MAFRKGCHAGLGKGEMNRTRFGALLSGFAGKVSALFCLLTAHALMGAQFDYTVENGEVTITHGTGLGGDVIIPETIDGLPVVAIGDSACEGDQTLYGVTIPNTVRRIGALAFYGCGELRSLTLSGSVISIGARAFAMTDLPVPGTSTRSIAPSPRCGGALGVGPRCVD